MFGGFGFDSVGSGTAAGVGAVLNDLWKFSPDTKQWLDELTAVDILVTEVADYRMLLNNEQARVNGYLQELDHPTAGRVLVSGTPITYNGEVRTESPPAPEMGQHTEEVLLEFGYSWEEIAALRDEGAI